MKKIKCGDQIEKCKFFPKNNFSKVISEDELLNLDTKYFDDFISQIPTIKRNILDYKKEKDIINTFMKFYDKIIDILEIELKKIKISTYIKNNVFYFVNGCCNCVS